MHYDLSWYLQQTFIMTDLLLQSQISNIFNVVCISLCQQMTSICCITPKIDLLRKEKWPYLKYSNVSSALKLKHSNRHITWCSSFFKLKYFPYYFLFVLKDSWSFWTFSNDVLQILQSWQRNVIEVIHQNWQLIFKLTRLQ